jgi:hypothetical protein
VIIGKNLSFKNSASMLSLRVMRIVVKMQGKEISYKKLLLKEECFLRKPKIRLKTLKRSKNSYQLELYGFAWPELEKAMRIISNSQHLKLFCVL